MRAAIAGMTMLRRREPSRHWSQRTTQCELEL
jgi:hypothetical protein